MGLSKAVGKFSGSGLPWLLLALDSGVCGSSAAPPWTARNAGQKGQAGGKEATRCDIQTAPGLNEKVMWKLER